MKYKIDRPRGRRSQEATHRRYTIRARKRMMARIKAERRIGMSVQLRLEGVTETIVVSHPCSALPVDFMKRMSQQSIQDTIRTRYEDIKTLFVAGNVEVKFPSYAYFVKKKKGLRISIKRILTSSLRTVYPSFLVKKFGAVLNERQMKEIMDKWVSFINTGA